MRHGWKTRFLERIYYEEKKEERERNRVLKAIATAEIMEKMREANNMSMWEKAHETH